MPGYPNYNTIQPLSIASLDPDVVEGLREIAKDEGYNRWFKDSKHNLKTQWESWEVAEIARIIRCTMDLPTYFPRGKWPTVAILEDWLEKGNAKFFSQHVGRR